jgi:hypothetical protein
MSVNVYPAIYVAGHPDLITHWNTYYATYGAPNRYLTYTLSTNNSLNNPEFVNFATNHYNSYGRSEGRKWRFNAEDYRIRYPDLQTAFAAPGFQQRNEESEELARHFITYGYPEGRTHNYLDINNISNVVGYTWQCFIWRCYLTNI